MAKYSSLLKDKLKELLSSRGLPTDGTKEQLIGRLEESDKVAAELDEAEEDEEAPAPAPAPVSVSVPAATVNATTTATIDTTATPAKEIPAPIEESAPVTETPDAPVETALATKSNEVATAPAVEEEKKLITPDELKEAAIELLNKKIARAEKFGEEDQIKKLAADLKRIEKFGISLDSPIAKELGYKQSQPKPENKTFHNRGSNRAGNSGRRDGFKNDRNRGVNNRSGRIYKTRRY